MCIATSECRYSLIIAALQFTNNIRMLLFKYIIIVRYVYYTVYPCTIYVTWPIRPGEDIYIG